MLNPTCVLMFRILPDIHWWHARQVCPTRWRIGWGGVPRPVGRRGHRVHVIAHGVGCARGPRARQAGGRQWHRSGGAHGSRLGGDDRHGRWLRSWRGGLRSGGRQLKTQLVSPVQRPAQLAADVLSLCAPAAADARWRRIASNRGETTRKRLFRIPLLYKY